MFSVMYYWYAWPVFNAKRLVAPSKKKKRIRKNNTSATPNVSPLTFRSQAQKRAHVQTWQEQLNPLYINEQPLPIEPLISRDNHRWLKQVPSRLEVCCCLNLILKWVEIFLTKWFVLLVKLLFVDLRRHSMVVFLVYTLHAGSRITLNTGCREDGMTFLRQQTSTQVHM